MGLTWVPVEHELPPDDEFVIWHHVQGNYTIWEIDKDMDWPWIEMAFGDNMPTHWARINSPPERTPQARVVDRKLRYSRKQLYQRTRKPRKEK